MNIAVGLICVKNQGLRQIIGLIIILIEELKYLEEREKGKFGQESERQTSETISKLSQVLKGFFTLKLPFLRFLLREKTVGQREKREIFQ